jgi:hypothetical protein
MGCVQRAAVQRELKREAQSFWYFGTEFPQPKDEKPFRVCWR